MLKLKDVVDEVKTVGYRTNCKTSSFAVLQSLFVVTMTGLCIIMRKQRRNNDHMRTIKETINGFLNTDKGFQGFHINISSE